MTVAVEDWIAISEILASCAMTLDQRRIDEWMGLFTPDAVIEIAGREPLTTPEERRRMGEGTSRGLHQPGTPVIRTGEAGGGGEAGGSGEDEAGGRGGDGATAVAEQSFIFHNLVTGTVVLGWYRDELVKRDRWYISRREIRFQPEAAT